MDITNNYEHNDGNNNKDEKFEGWEFLVEEAG